MALWMWYPGDFEIYTANKVMFRRDYRLCAEPPVWRVDNVWQNVFYSKEVDISKDETITINAGGTIAIMMNYATRLFPDSNGHYVLPKGRYNLEISVSSFGNLPALYVCGETINSGREWFVSTSSGTCAIRRKVGVWTFDSPNSPPWDYKLETKEIEAISTQNTPNGVLVDFGKEVFGYICLKGIQGSGTIGCYYGESLQEAQDIEKCETFDIVECIDESNIRLEKSRAMRYVFVTNAEGVSVSEVYLLFEYLPVEYRGKFLSSNTLLNRIYDTALYTLHLNTREMFLDGIKRDRWCWSGDAYQSFLMNYYSFFNVDVNRRTLMALRGKDPVEMHINLIPDYTFYWFISLYDHYIYTGDMEFIEVIYDKAVTLMEYCISSLSERGFIEGRNCDWVFVDWADMEKRGALSVEQILFCRSLYVMSHLAELMKDEDHKQQFEHLHCELVEKVFKTFWSDDLGALQHSLTDGKITEKITKYSNIFALMYGYFDEKKRNTVINRVIKNDEIQKITTPYGKFFELSGLCEAGETEFVKNEILEYWGGMLDLGATSFWEEYNPSAEDHLSMYGRPYGKSLCHAWGASPIYLLGRYFLGVHPVTVGYSEYEIRPNLGGLEWISGSVPTPDGDIEVFMNDHQIKVKSSCGGRGKLFIRSDVEPLCSEGKFKKLSGGIFELDIRCNIEYIIKYIK